MVVLAVAVIELFWRIGSSSLFVDEVSSWYAAHGSLGELFHRVRVYEVAPPGYYLLLHAWIGLFGDAEATMRLLSAIAGVLLVGAIYWVGRRFGGPLVAFLGALVAALSPLVIEYGQEVRAYGWAMLAATLAVGGVLQAEQAAGHRGRWLGLAAVAAVCALWFHYTAVFVIVPLVGWVGFCKALSPRLRFRFAAAVGVGGVLVLPFLVSQLQTGNQNAIGPYAQLTLYNLKRVVGAPFDRTYPLLGSAQTTVVAILVILAVALLLLPRARTRLRHARLLALLAGGGPVLLIVLTLVGRHVLISRYDAVVVPFMALALAADVTVFPPAGVVVVVLALYVALPASRLAHRPDHFYPDTRSAMRFVARDWHRGEILVGGAGYPGLGASLQYYAAHLLPPNTIGVGFNVLPKVLELPSVHRVALITAPLGSPRQIRQSFAKVHWHLVALQSVPGAVPMQALVATRNRHRT